MLTAPFSRPSFSTPTSDRSTRLHNALASYRPRQKLPFYYLVRRPSQRPVFCMSVVSAIPQPPRQSTCFCPRGACKHYLSAHALDGNKHGHAISVLLPSLVTSIARLRHDTEFSMVVDLLNQVSFQVVPTVASLVTRPLPPALSARFSHHHLHVCMASNPHCNTVHPRALILWRPRSLHNRCVCLLPAIFRPNDGCERGYLFAVLA